MKQRSLSIEHRAFSIWHWLWLAVLAFAMNGRAASVTFAWDANKETNVVAYRIYAVATNNGTMTQTQTQVSGPATTVTLSNLVDGVTYTFYATAVNAQALESAPSTSIQYTTPPPLPSPPLIRAGALYSFSSNLWYFSGSWQLSSNAAASGTPVVFAWRLSATNGWATNGFTTNLSLALTAPAMPILFEVWGTNSAGSSAIASLQFARPAPVQNLHTAP